LDVVTGKTRRLRKGRKLVRGNRSQSLSSKFWLNSLDHRRILRRERSKRIVFILDCSLSNRLETLDLFPLVEDIADLFLMILKIRVSGMS
jgi:hypothetical protein